MPGGPVERQVRLDIAEMGTLTGARRSIAEICYALARSLDSDELASPASVARELALRLADLERTAGGREVSAGDRIAADIADELAPRRRAVPSASA
jgi:hypothetical protein